MSCKKCGSVKTVVLRKKDFYCDSCFMVNTNHKFRACIGKNKVLYPNENVLICISGGVGSTVLLDLLSYSFTLDNNKKLRIFPLFLHIIDNNSSDIAESILNQCLNYNFNVYMVHISDYMNDNYQLPLVNSIPVPKNNDAKDFDDMVTSMLPTARNDFLLKVKRTLFIKYAAQLECKTIFTAETTSTLANNLLCNLAIGRGSQVQSDVGFADVRDDKVKILRPMKDISVEELEYYIKIKQLSPLSKEDVQKNSLQSVINSFIKDLQDNFPATISTVCKTADKIGDYDEDTTNEKCSICEGALNTRTQQLSALEATNISRVISLGNTTNCNTNEDLKQLEKAANHIMFPLVNKRLCYGCSRNYSEMNESKLPTHVLETLNV